MTTSQLVACTKVLAPHISSPLCQEQMIEAARLVATSVDGVQASCFVCISNFISLESKHTKSAMFIPLPSASYSTTN